MFNEIYKKYNRKIYNFIYYKTGNEIIAEELMQETFITLYEMRNIEEISEKEIKKVLYTIAKNKIMNNNSSIKRRKEKLENNISELTDDIIINPESIINERETSNEIKDALNELTEMQRKVLVLIKSNGLSYKETAKLLNKSENEIKQLLHRAKNSFKRILENKYPEIAARYKHASKLKSIIILVLTASMITGIVYASYKVYEHFKNPTTYTLEARNKTIDESTVSISREEAKNIISNYLNVLEIKDYNIENINLIKDGLYNKVSWSLLEKNKFRIDIDANSGEITKYNCFNNEKAKRKKTKEEIAKYIETVYKELNFNEEYKLINKNVNIQTSLKVTDFIYAKSEEDIYNSVLIQYVTEYGRVQNILNISTLIDGKEITITKDKAIEILKENYDVTSIESVELVLNGNIYLNNKYNEDVSSTDYLEIDREVSTKEIKAIWIIEYNNGLKVKIDSETGEIQRTNETNYEEKK